jgi:hypothetical protein
MFPQDSGPTYRSSHQRLAGHAMPNSEASRHHSRLILDVIRVWNLHLARFRRSVQIQKFRFPSRIRTAHFAFFDCHSFPQFFTNSGHHLLCSHLTNNLVRIPHHNLIVRAELPRRSRAVRALNVALPPHVQQPRINPHSTKHHRFAPCYRYRHPLLLCRLSLSLWPMCSRTF